MASIKERARWEKWFNDVTDRMKRQRESITRLVFITTHSMAALEEIAAMDPQGDEWDDAEAFSRAREAAQKALDTIKGPASAEVPAAVALATEPEPTDPHRRNGLTE